MERLKIDFYELKEADPSITEHRDQLQSLLDRPATSKDFDKPTQMQTVRVRKEAHAGFVA